MNNKNYNFKRNTLDILRSVFKIPLFERILLKLVSGIEYGHSLTKLSPNHYQYSKKEIRFVRRNNINYKLDISDIVDWFIYFGFKESAKSKLLSLTKKEDIVIDVGSNVGEISMNLAETIGTKGEVHSFEPHPLNYQRFKANLKLNNFKNIFLNNLALGDKSDNLKIIVVDEYNYGKNRISRIEFESKYNSELIKVITLDEYIFTKNIDKVNLIKIDVEGFEMNVLLGAIKTIKKYSPTLFIEIDESNLKEQNHYPIEIINFLIDYGYTLFNAQSNKRIIEKDDFSKCHFDLIATKCDSL